MKIEFFLFFSFYDFFVNYSQVSSFIYHFSWRIDLKICIFLVYCQNKLRYAILPQLPSSFASTWIDNMIENLLAVQVLVFLWHFF